MHSDVVLWGVRRPTDSLFVDSIRKEASKAIDNLLKTLSTTEERGTLHAVVHSFCLDLDQCLIKTKSLPPTSSIADLEMMLLYNLLYASALEGQLKETTSSHTVLSARAGCVLLSLNRAQQVTGIDRRDLQGGSGHFGESDVQQISRLLSSLLSTLHVLGNVALGRSVGLLTCLWSLLSLGDSSDQSSLPSALSTLCHWPPKSSEVILKHGFLLLEVPPSLVKEEAEIKSEGSEQHRELVHSFSSLLLALSCFNQRKWKECQKLASKVDQPRSWKSLATLLTARAMLAEGNCLGAVGVLHTALSDVMSAPDSPGVVSHAYRLLASCYTAQGLPRLATEMLRHCLEIDPRSAPALLLLTTQFRSLQQEDAALQCLRTLVKAAEKVESKDSVRPLLLDDLLLKTVVAEVKVTVSQALYLLAVRLAQLEKFEESAEVYTKLIHVYEQSTMDSSIPDNALRPHNAAPSDNASQQPKDSTVQDNAFKQPKGSIVKDNASQQPKSSAVKDAACQKPKDDACQQPPPDSAPSLPDLLTVCRLTAETLLQIPRYPQCLQLCDRVLAAISSSSSPLSSNPTSSSDYPLLHHRNNSPETLTQHGAATHSQPGLDLRRSFDRHRGTQEDKGSILSQTTASSMDYPLLHRRNPERHIGTQGDDSLIQSQTATETDFLSRLKAGRRKRCLSSEGGDDGGGFKEGEEEGVEWTTEENRALVTVCKAQCLVAQGHARTAAGALNRAFQGLMACWRKVGGQRARKSEWASSWPQPSTSDPKRPRYSLGQQGGTASVSCAVVQIGERPNGNGSRNSSGSIFDLHPSDGQTPDGNVNKSMSTTQKMPGTGSTSKYNRTSDQTPTGYREVKSISTHTTPANHTVKLFSGIPSASVTSPFETSIFGNASEPIGGLEPPVVTTATGDRLNLTYDFLRDCLQRKAKLALPALDGDLFVGFDRVQLGDDINADSKCTMTLTGHPDYALVVKFGETFDQNYGKLTFRMSQTRVEEREAPDPHNVIRQSSLAYWDRVAITKPGFKVWLVLQGGHDSFIGFKTRDIGLNFTWVPKSSLPGLETVIVNRSLGFKIWFTFHEEGTAPPTRLADNKWNCTRDGWWQFQPHFPCNLEEDCLNGVDEEMCPYRSRRCGPKEFVANNKCYIFVQGASVSWNDADVVCRRRGGRLVSLNTPEEWKAVLEVVMTYKSFGADINIGLKSAPQTLSQMYRQTWQHVDTSIAYYIPKNISNEGKPFKPTCALLRIANRGFVYLKPSKCDDNGTTRTSICEQTEGFMNILPTTNVKIKVAFKMRPPTTANNFTTFVACPQQHMTHSFLACDVNSACWGSGSVSSCGASLSPLPPSFSCGDGEQSVSYTLLCDFRSDCTDQSDENFCVYLPCDPTDEFECRSGQCVAYQTVCDDITHCLDGSDEEHCTFSIDFTQTNITTPALVRFGGPNAFTLIAVNDTNVGGEYNACPVNHYACPSNGYCLPVFTRCNGVHDCPDRADEVGCDDGYTCPGLYRCRSSRVCVSEAEICDGTAHCPERDDELLCNSTCPVSCTCYGLAFLCRDAFRARDFPRLTYLDATGSGMHAADVVNNSMLVHLRLAACGMKEVPRLSLSNLHSLDLSHNYLAKVTGQHLSHLPNLRNLTLAANPLTSIFSLRGGGVSPVGLFPYLRHLDLSAVPMTSFLLTILDPFPNLHVLNLSGCHVDMLSGEGRDVPASLRVLDVRGCPLTFFPADLLRNLSRLQDMWADSYKLCCPQMLPSRFNLARCWAPSDEISSCENLLRSNVYRGCLVFFASMALLGNLVAFVSRLVLGNIKNGFDIFTIMLCASDFLMGVYLAVIGIADRHYMGSFLWSEVTWRHSTGCKVAGFLSLASNEVSAFVVCLITLDRFLVLRFPFSSVRFTKKSGMLVSCVAWLVGAVLASVPLLPPAAHWTFYSLNGICVPLPVTRKEFPGRRYSFGLLVVLNFVLFVLTAAGQLFIYLSVQKNSLQLSDSTKQASRDTRLARRLLTIVMSDFLCWFPIGLLGILSSGGTPISGEVNVAMAIFVLPLNSAINPYLYTVNLLLEKRRVRNEQRLVNMLMLRLKQREQP